MSYMRHLWELPNSSISRQIDLKQQTKRAHLEGRNGGKIEELICYLPIVDEVSRNANLSTPKRRRSIGNIKLKQ